MGMVHAVTVDGFEVLNLVCRKTDRILIGIVIWANQNSVVLRVVPCE